MRKVVIVAAALMLAALTVTAWQQALAPAPSGELSVQQPKQEASVATLQQHHVAALDAARRLTAAYQELDRAAAEVAARARACRDAALKGSAVQRDALERLGRAVDEYDRLRIRLGSQVLALETSMEQESRKFQTLSNAMKSAHDTGQATIRNTR